jgi:cysteine desulfurase
MRQVYLDHQASTPLLPEVFEAMKPYFIDQFGSASSLHQHGLRARDALERARAQISVLINAESAEEIIFTASGTEATNLAIKGTAYASHSRGDHLIVTETDHPAILNSAAFLEKQGFSITRLKVDRDGFVDAGDLKQAITDKTVLVAIHHANHDIGTIQPVRAISEITQEKGIPLFLDCQASAGWLSINVQELGVQLVSFSSHRFYGPKGVGVLYRNRRARLTNLIHGGSQEGGRRAGTENVPAIVGAGAAAEIAANQLPARMPYTARLQNELWTGLRQKVSYLALNGPPPGSKRVCNNLNVSAEFLEGEALLLRLDMQGIAVAAGTSCASKALKVSHVLAAIGLDHSVAQGSVIMTLGSENTEEEIQHVIDVFSRTVTQLREMSPMWDEFDRGLISSITQPAQV